LVKVYIKLHHATSGTVVIEQEGQVLPQQTTAPIPFPVPTQQDYLIGTVNYPGSQVDLVLTDPSGKQVGEDYPGANITKDLGMGLVTVAKPKSGQWNLSVYGNDVPAQGEPYYAAASTRASTITPASANNTGGGLGVALIILAIAGGGIYAVVLLNRRKSQRGGIVSNNYRVDRVKLVSLNGPHSGIDFEISDGSIIGRASTCQIRLRDIAVSRQHARLRYSQGGWYLQDLNSSGGTYINGQRIAAQRLKSGDRIRFGSTEFQFFA
jgi:hypothetical protein